MAIPFLGLNALATAGTFNALLARNVVFAQIFQGHIFFALWLIRTFHVLITNDRYEVPSFEHFVNGDVSAFIRAEYVVHAMLRTLLEQAVIAKHMIVGVLIHGQCNHATVTTEAMAR